MYHLIFILIRCEKPESLLCYQPPLVGVIVSDEFLAKETDHFS